MKRLLAAVSLLAMGLMLAPSLVAQTTLVNHLTMNQWVRSSEPGLLKGRVILPKVNNEVEAIAGVKVSILNRDGETLRATSDSKGEFAIQGVTPGVYALTARGDNLFACCAVHVIENGEGVQAKYPDVAEVAITNVDYTIVNTAVIRYLPPSGESLNASIAGAELDALSSQVCGSDLFRVAQFQGGMKGQLYAAGAVGSKLQGVHVTNVFLFKDSMQIDRTLTDESGKFAFETTPAGQYSLLAVGRSGIGLMSFELVDEAVLTASVQTAPSGNGQFVGLGHRHGTGCCCQEFTMQVAPMPEIVDCVESVVVEEQVIQGDCVAGCECGCGEVMAPLPGGGMVSGYGGGGGGYGGGGGGGYGGGGLGGIAALAGIGAIIAATNDDNNAIIPPIVASPAIPN